MLFATPPSDSPVATATQDWPSTPLVEEDKEEQVQPLQSRRGAPSTLASCDGVEVGKAATEEGPFLSREPIGTGELLALLGPARP